MTEILIQVSDASNPIAIAQGIADWVLHSFRMSGYRDNDMEFIETVGKTLLLYAEYVKRSEENEQAD